MDGSTSIPLRCNPVGAVCSLNSGGRRAGKYALPVATPAAQLEEEGEYYVPDLLRESDYEPEPALYAAAEADTRRLHKAERSVDEALMLSQVLRASMGDAGDRRAMQVETVLRIVEKKLRKARSQLDEHDARYLNLFMAYFELKGGSDGR